MCPEVSIVIPTCGREALLSRCLAALLAQDYSREKIEIVVVNDSGKALGDSVWSSPSVVVVSTPESRGPAAARNLGIRSSRGRIVCFIDDDCVASPDWVGAMVRAHDECPEAAVVGGWTETATDKITVLLGQFLANGSIATDIGGCREIIFFPTCNVSFKRPVLEEERFNEAFPLPGGEDLELCWRLYKKGFRFVWNRAIRVTHFRDGRLRGCLDQAYKYGRGNFLVQAIHRDHPLLRELATGKSRFWLATLVNILKIPRFSYILGAALIREHKIVLPLKKAAVYACFALHKIFYIAGNIVEFMSSERRWSQPVNRIPELLILDITHTCNLTCRICDIWKTASTEPAMALEDVKALLTQAQELGIKVIALSGGEVLLRKDIFDIFNHARALGMKNLGILTNGILLQGYFDRLRPYFLEGIISPVISLDSLQEKTHNYFRNSDIAWQETVKSLQALAVLKKDHPQVNFNLITIILNDNLEELTALVEFARSINANSLQFQVLLPNNLMMAERKDSLFGVKASRIGLLDDVINRLIRLKEEHPPLIRNSVQNLVLIKKYCRGALNGSDVQCCSGRKTILVSNQGMCTTCFSAYGNIREQTLKEIMTGSKIVKAQKAVQRCQRPCLLPCFCD